VGLRASAPATTANLGPGFDCLGAALDIDLVVELGDGEPLPKRIQKAIRAGGAPKDEYTGTITSSIPKTRGLGSSAACVAAGLLLGCALAKKEPDLDELLRLGTPIEGHPDNLAPALFGGFVLVTPDGRVMRFEVTSKIRPLVLVPPFTLSTKQARAKLVDHTLTVKEAAQNVAWGSALVAMLNGSSPVSREALFECTQDHIHQPPRREVLKEAGEVLERLRSEGVAAAVSGAGPSLVCLVLPDDPSPAAPAGWEVLEPGWAATGARLL
jgi:homoserine kinase